MAGEFAEFRVHGHAAAQPLLGAAVATALGIVADRFGGGAFNALTPLQWWLAALIATVAGAAAFARGRFNTSLAFVLTTCFSLGGAWHDLNWNYEQSDNLALYASHASEPVCIEAVARSPSKWSPAPETSPLRAIPGEPYSEIEVGITRVRDGTDWHAASGNVRLRVNGILPEITPGDQLMVFGRMAKVTPAMNPGQYDSAAAQRAMGRHCELFTQSPECVTVIERASILSPRTWFAIVGRWCQSQVARYVDTEQQPIAQALLLGVRGGLDEETAEAFLKTGTVHLLVVSGMHVGLIAAATWFLVALFPVGEHWRLVTTAIVVMGYAAVIGLQPSVVRSTVLVLLTLLALAQYRHATSTNCLAAAALLVMLLNPSELFRPGTQLSFLGVAAVVSAATMMPGKNLADPLVRMIHSYMDWPELTARWVASRSATVFVASCVVWIVVTPLVLYHSHIASPSASVLTFLAWPLMAVALMSGLVICIVGPMVPLVAWLLGKLCGICLLTSSAVIDRGASMPLSHFYGAGPSTWWLVVFYSFLGLCFLVPRWRPRWQTQVSLAALWMAIGFSASAWNGNPSDELRCTMLSVGHGTCVVLEMPSGETLLYDAGSLGSPRGAANTISSYLWSRGISHIDAIVISHADVDHYNAVPDLLDRFGVGTVCVSPLMFDPWATGGDLTAPNYMKERIEAAGVPIREIWMNDRVRVADERVNIEVLHPPRVGVPGRDNANSLLLSIEFAGQRILLPGDLESPGIETVLAEAPLDVDVLLAPHHGSRFSDPPGFAEWCTPEWVVLSGRDNPEDTRITTSSYEAVGAAIYHTANHGAITFKFGPSGMQCQGFRE